MWKTILLVIVLGGLLAAAIWGLPQVFAAYGHEISLHGWIALAAGTLLSLALGFGLMALSFLSARRGFDDRAQWEDESETSDRPNDGPD